MGSREVEGRLEDLLESELASIGGALKIRLDKCPLAKYAIKGSPLPPLPAKPNTLYSRESFVDTVCWTLG